MAESSVPATLSAPAEPDAAREETRRSPVAEVTHAWLSRRKVRVGEPVTLRVEAVNQGREAKTGEIAVVFRRRPELRLSYRSDLTAPVRRSGRDSSDGYSKRSGRPEVRARTSGWAHGEAHWLAVRLVPASTGQIVLAYSFRLEGSEPTSGSPSGNETGRTVAIEAVRTLRGGNR